MTDDIEITQSSKERGAALMTAWDWGYDAAIDYRDAVDLWNARGRKGPKPQPQLNPWRLS